MNVYGRLPGRAQACRCCVRQKEAEQWLAKYEQKAKENREKIKGAVKEGETAVIINVREKKISFLGDNYGRGGEVMRMSITFLSA
ncbi:hypothetical protein RQP52_35225 [Paenibacillus sp. PFR10]|uniref:Uncharacterized protein n=2 Tax=Paenibacillus TaxID=44249 RepID=A0ABU3RPW2_9BACL|nr:hypothetical protein [Paenibacillus sp. PFR10]MDU0206323.1 hypothetical protein [Paenibacillus sp. PFR10]